MADSTPEEVQVIPSKAGRWRVEADGKKLGKDHEDRKAAIAAAREAAGARTEDVFDSDGNKIGTIERAGARVVLMRADGTEYGELEAPAGDPSTSPIRVSIEPAEESTDAGGM